MNLEEVAEFIKIIEVSEDEVMKALLTAFSPVDPGAQRQSWKQNKYYGNTSPSTQDIWSIYSDSDFRCSECKSQRRLTLDHIDKNRTNHSLDNLRVLCFDCNRAKARNSNDKNKNHKLRIYRATLKLVKTLNRFPTQKEIIAEANIDNISGATYMVRYLKRRLLYDK